MVVRQYVVLHCDLHAVVILPFGTSCTLWLQCCAESTNKWTCMQGVYGVQEGGQGQKTAK